jgi:hypothetical protein
MKITSYVFLKDFKKLLLALSEFSVYDEIEKIIKISGNIDAQHRDTAVVTMKSLF